MKLADISEVSIPNITISGSSSYSSTLNIFPRTVDATDAPRKSTPQNSNMDAMITACFNVIDLDATDVAYRQLMYAGKEIAAVFWDAENRNRSISCA